MLRWPVLAVLAACQHEASAAACMAAWLQATIPVEGKACSSSSGHQLRNEQIRRVNGRMKERDACEYAVRFICL